MLAREGRIEAAVACAMAHQATLGLEKAHAAGVVHRDLKPANVFLVERDDGTTLVKLVDFGIAKFVREAHDARFAPKGITRRGMAVGTPQYMSPEQAQALDTVDHRTDVYSLGAVLFEAIAGQPHLPERPTYEQTILQLVSTTAPRLRAFAPEIPAALDDLVAQMLEHDVARRVRDMPTVRQRLDSIYPELRGSRMKLKPSRPPPGPRVYWNGAGAGSHPQAPTVAESAVLARPRRKQPMLTVAVLAIALGVTLGLAAMWTGWKGAGARTDQAQSAPPIATTFAAQPVSTPAPLVTAVAPTPSVTTATTTIASPTPTPGKRVAPSAPAVHSPRDQVGAAGISSQF